MNQPRAGWPRIMQFRPPGGVKRKHYINGGRWNVRRVRDQRVFSDARMVPRWKATSGGRARAFERYFDSWPEAIEWAQFVARMFQSDQRVARGRYYEMIEAPRQRQMEWLFSQRGHEMTTVNASGETSGDAV